MVELVSSFSIESKGPPDSSAPGVVFISGLFAGGWFWDEVWNQVPEGAPVARLNEAYALLDGRQARSIEKSTAATADAIERSGLTRPIVCGNSVGALIALDYAARYPDRVAGIFVSGAPGMGGILPGVGKNPSYSREYFDSLVDDVFYDRSNVSEERLEETYHLLRGRPQLANVAGALRAARMYNTRKALRRVECPALFVWGKHDHITPCTRWVDEIPKVFGVDVHVLDESGHSPMIEQPAVTSALINAFYEEVEARERSLSNT